MFVFILLLALGVVETARALLNIHQLTQAAREGARVASLTPALDSSASNARVRTQIEKVLTNMGKDISKVRIQIQPVDTGGDGIPDLVDVTIEEDFNQITPIAFIPGLNGKTLQATISMPVFMPQDTAQGETA